MHELVILIAKYAIALPVLIAVYIWLKADHSSKRNLVITIVGGGIITLILAKLGSHLYNDPRPFVVGHFKPYFTHSADNGFPSDHTLLAGLLGFSTLYFSRKWGYLSLAIALAIGLARVIAGVHHLVDILGSLVFSFIGVWVVTQLLKTTRQKSPSDDA